MAREPEWTRPHTTPASATDRRGRAPDVAVVGGGIVGLATAAHLAEAGASVVLYEGEALAAGASGRNSGVVQRPFDEALVPLYAETLALYRALEARGVPGLMLPAEPAGLLLISRCPDAVALIAGDLRARFADLAPEILDGPGLRLLEPALAEGIVACRVPIGFPVAPGAPAYAYATLVERLGVRIRLGRPVSVAIEAGRAVGVRMGVDLEAAGAVVVAAGRWTADVIDPTGRWRPVRPLWGAVVEVLLAGAPRHILEEAEMDEALGTGPVAVAGAVDAMSGDAGDESTRPGLEPTQSPEFSLVTAAGVSAVGSTFLEDEPDLRDWEVPILQRAAEFVPAVADAAIRGVRSCARPATADGRPLLGRVPGVDGLYMATGHGPWGISTGPASGRLVADLVVGRPVDIPPEIDAARAGSPFDA